MTDLPTIQVDGGNIRPSFVQGHPIFKVTPSECTISDGEYVLIRRDRIFQLTDDPVQGAVLMLMMEADDD
jgi:hypothetical protein